MILAGDIGGTKTLLGLFEPSTPRPRPVSSVRTFGTLEFGDLASMLGVFLKDRPATGAVIDAACLGVAGPIIGDTARLTNVPLQVDAREVATALGVRRVRLLNDLEALAYGVSVLHESEVHTLQKGEASGTGNLAVIAAGTGLGQALLHNVNGRLIPSPSEAGRADFAARTEREIAILRDLIARQGHAATEDVVSGRGFVNIHRITHATAACTAAVDLSHPDAPAAISSAALDQRCRSCMETLDLFVSAYGAEAGNLALRTVATGGVYVGGGIAPRILPALTSGTFLRAFRAKPPFEPMLDKIPVKVILNRETGLLGAAVFAATERF
jgi:glucokinase